MANSAALDTISNLWYSTKLIDFEEPNLKNYIGNDEIYRFTWLRSFHAPIVIKFQKNNDKYILSTKKMIDYDGYKPNEYLVNNTQQLSAAAWDNWKIKLGRNNIWLKPTIQEDNSTDGAQWILEENIKGNYRFIVCRSDRELRDCCLHLLKLSKLKLSEDEIY